MKLLCAFLLLVSPIFAATYYVSYTSGNDANAGTAVDGGGIPTNPIKRAPGMTGYTGAITPAAGDTFVFQGGDTWPSGCFPWTVSQSGSAGNLITYTSNLTWYTGGAWTQPTLDANHTEPAGGMLKGTSRSYLLFDRLYFLNYATSGVSDGKKAIQFDNSQQIGFSRCKFKTYSWLTVYHALASAGTYSNFYVTDSECTDTGTLMWVGVAANNVTVAGITMTGNWIHDFTSKIGGAYPNGVHSDGLLHSYRGGANTGYTVTGIDIGNNLITGDFRRSYGNDGGVTNFCSIEHGGSGKIYNNIIAPSPTASGLAESWLGGGLYTGNVLEFFGNVLWCTGSSPASGGFLFYGSAGTVRLKNNIVQGFQYAINLQGTGFTFDSDYNTLVSNSSQLYNGSAYRSYAQWQSDGNDTHSTLGSVATFVNAPLDMRLAAGSNAIGSGTSGGNIPTQGISAAATFPGPALTTFALDRGPYVYSAAAPPTAPSALLAVAASASQINLSWTDNSSTETGFELERSADGVSGWSNINSPAANATSYSNTGLTASTVYYYRIRAVNASGNSSYSATASATTNASGSPTTTRVPPAIRALSVGF